jgi:hypothetical protein
LIEKELKVPPIIEAKDWIDTEYPPERFSYYFYMLEYEKFGLSLL